MNGWKNSVLTLHELAGEVPYQYDWLLAQSRLPNREDRLPTIMRNKKQEIILSDFYDWLRAMYGPSGKYRGQAEFDNEIDARMDAARKMVH